jgi:hypothetical protein
MKNTACCDITSCGLADVYLLFVGRYRKASRALLVDGCFSCWTYSSTMNAGVACSPGTLINFYQTTWCHIPEDSNIQFSRRLLS